jgi:integrase
MALFKRGDTWWYEFLFARPRVRESAKTTSKTIAKLAEQKRRRELEQASTVWKINGMSGLKTVKELGQAYLHDYGLRHRSVNFAVYAVGNVLRHLGELMSFDVTEQTVIEYQTARLKESAAPKTINEEVGFFLRLLGEQGDVIRVRLRRRKILKLAVRNQVGRAFSPEEKDALLAAAKTARSPAIYPALVLALNAGMRDAEIRGLQWGRLDLSRAYLTVGDSKTAAGEGRTIPLNSTLLAAMLEYSKWYNKRFGTIQP